MGRGEVVATVRGVVGEMVGDVRFAVVGGSALTRHRTSVSDLDVVVVTGPRDAPYRCSLRRDGWPVEVLVHDEESLAAYCADNLARRWPGIPRLLAEGVIVVDDGTAASWQARMRERIAAGPAPAAAAEIDAARYDLTDQLDDLTGAEEGDGDGAEAAFIRARVLTLTARLALLAGRHWIGSGKWLLRELRDHDAGLAARLGAAAASSADLDAAARTVLAGVGGPLWSGYSVTDPRNP
jgi:hypothetical protein